MVRVTTPTGVEDHADGVRFALGNEEDSTVGHLFILAASEGEVAVYAPGQWLVAVNVLSPA